MKIVQIGIIAGIILGILDVLLILPVPFPNKELVILGAFSNRFALGLFTVTAQLGLPRWQQGIVVGFLISILPAVSNPSFALLIFGTGIIAGLITGAVTQRFIKNS